MIELPATPIPAEEELEILNADIAALTSANIECPLVKAIEEAIAALDRAIEARKPDD